MSMGANGGAVAPRAPDDWRAAAQRSAVGAEPLTRHAGDGALDALAASLAATALRPFSSVSPPRRSSSPTSRAASPACARALFRVLEAVSARAGADALWSRRFARAAALAAATIGRPLAPLDLRRLGLAGAAAAALDPDDVAAAQLCDALRRAAGARRLVVWTGSEAMSGATRAEAIARWLGSSPAPAACAWAFTALAAAPLDAPAPATTAASLWDAVETVGVELSTEAVWALATATPAAAAARVASLGLGGDAAASAWLDWLRALCREAGEDA